jgi:hypothetical protein
MQPAVAPLPRFHDMSNANAGMMFGNPYGNVMMGPPGGDMHGHMMDMNRMNYPNRW